MHTTLIVTMFFVVMSAMYPFAFIIFKELDMTISNKKPKYGKNTATE